MILVVVNILANAAPNVDKATISGMMKRPLPRPLFTPKGCNIVRISYTQLHCNIQECLTIATASVLSISS